MQDQPRPDPSGETSAAGSEASSVDEALARARDHGRVALREALFALRWTIEAGSLATTGGPSTERPWLGSLTALVESAARGLEAEGGPASHVLETVLEALDQEIARWERRGREDSEARAVLRAFLGLRELLWEFGVRPSARRERSERPDARRPRGRGGRGAQGARFERVPVEG